MDYIKSKSKALKMAQNAVGMPIGCKNNWQVYGPWTRDDLSGPSTSINANSYREALNRRAEWVAGIALDLMGASSEARYFADYAHSCEKPMTARWLVDYALARYPISTET